MMHLLTDARGPKISGSISNSSSIMRWRGAFNTSPPNWSWNATQRVSHAVRGSEGQRVQAASGAFNCYKKVQLANEQVLSSIESPAPDWRAAEWPCATRVHPPPDHCSSAGRQSTAALLEVEAVWGASASRHRICDNRFGPVCWSSSWRLKNTCNLIFHYACVNQVRAVWLH